MSGSFTSSYTDCCDDCGICFYGACCTPCLYGENVDKLEGGGCAGPCLSYYCLSLVGSLVPFMCLQGLVAGPNRKKIRDMHGLKEEPCSDCCIHYWCSPCAVCQEAREIKARGVCPAPPGAKPIYSNAPPMQTMAAPGMAKTT